MRVLLTLARRHEPTITRGASLAYFVGELVWRISLRGDVAARPAASTLTGRYYYRLRESARRLAGFRMMPTMSKNQFNSHTHYRAISRFRGK